MEAVCCFESHISTCLWSRNFDLWSTSRFVCFTGCWVFWDGWIIWCL